MRQLGISKFCILEANTADDFNDCCQIICGDLDISHDIRRFTPANFLRVLQTIDFDAIASIDELDDLPRNSDIRRSFAKFAKSASNQADQMRIKFIFSGIGADAHDLFDGHLSTDRNLPQTSAPSAPQELGLETFLRFGCGTPHGRIAVSRTDAFASEAVVSRTTYIRWASTPLLPLPAITPLALPPSGSSMKGVARL